MTRKEQLETLRKRGVHWKDGEPLRSLQPKWLPYVSDPGWLSIERWVEFVNRLHNPEILSGLSAQEAMEQIGQVNFGIPGYRINDDPEVLLSLIREAHRTLQAVATEPRSAGIDHLEPDPFTLFTTALGLADQTRVRQCSVCGRLLFAKRRDKTACAGACSDTARQRRFRENKHYNENRKRNRRATAAHEARRKKSIRQALKGGRR